MWVCAWVIEVWVCELGEVLVGVVEVMVSVKWEVIGYDVIVVVLGGVVEGVSEGWCCICGGGIWV